MACFANLLHVIIQKHFIFSYNSYIFKKCEVLQIHLAFCDIMIFPRWL